MAAFLIAPVFVYVADSIGGSSAEGTHVVLWISLGIVAVGTAFAVAVYLAGRARLQTPQMTTFLDGDGPALESPPLMATLRRGEDVGDRLPDLGPRSGAPSGSSNPKVTAGPS